MYIEYTMVTPRKRPITRLHKKRSHGWGDSRNQRCDVTVAFPSSSRDTNYTCTYMLLQLFYMLLLGFRQRGEVYIPSPKQKKKHTYSGSVCFNPWVPPTPDVFVFILSSLADMAF